MKASESQKSDYSNNLCDIDEGIENKPLCHTVRYDYYININIDFLCIEMLSFVICLCILTLFSFLFFYFY